MSKRRYRIFSDTAFDGSYAYVTYRNDKEPEKTHVNSIQQRAETSLHETFHQLFNLLVIGLIIQLPLYYNIIEKHPFNALLLSGCMLIVLIAVFNEIRFYFYYKIHKIKTYRINNEQIILHCSCCGAEYYENTIKRGWKCGNDIANKNDT